MSEHIKKGSVPLEGNRMMAVVEAEGMVRLQVRDRKGVLRSQEELSPANARALGAMLYIESRLPRGGDDEGTDRGG